MRTSLVDVGCEALGEGNHIGHLLRAYVEVRSKFITHKPAALLGVIRGLVRPDLLIEIEVVAAVPAGKVKGDQ